MVSRNISIFLSLTSKLIKFLIRNLIFLTKIISQISHFQALAPDGENQPSTEVDLFISTEKIMVLNTDLKEIMMDHALRTISYIAGEFIFLSKLEFCG